MNGRSHQLIKIIRFLHFFLSKKNRNWTKLIIKSSLKLCETYPENFIIPASVDDFLIEISAKFRFKKRVFALSYYFHSKKVLLFYFFNFYFISIYLVVGMYFPFWTTIYRIQKKSLFRRRKIFLSIFKSNTTKIDCYFWWKNTRFENIYLLFFIKKKLGK